MKNLLSSAVVKPKKQTIDNTGPNLDKTCNQLSDSWPLSWNINKILFCCKTFKKTFEQGVVKF